MAKVTQVIILSSLKLHAQAWQNLLSQEAFLEVLDAVEQAGDIKVAANENPVTILVDEIQLEPAEVDQLAEAWPKAGLLYLFEAMDARQIASLISSGAGGFISRRAEAAELARAIIAVGRGELVLPQEISGRVLKILAQGSAENKPSIDPLTDREVEVLGHLANGETNKDIAQRLMISVRTVEAHLRNIYGKLNVDSRTEAALWAVRIGLEAGGGELK